MVVTFSEYVLRQEYSNLIEQWEYLRLNDSFLISEAENPMDRYGIRGAAQSLGQGMRNLGKDAMQAAQRGITYLSTTGLNLAKRKADELMSMGLPKLQAALASKGYPNLLQKLNKYRNGLMILGLIGAGGLMALMPQAKTMNPADINRALNLPNGSYEQMDPDVQKVILSGAEVSEDLEDSENVKNIENTQGMNAEFGDTVVVNKATGMTRTKFTDEDGEWLLYQQPIRTRNPVTQQSQGDVFEMFAKKNYQDQTGTFPDNEHKNFYGVKKGQQNYQVAFKIKTP